MHAVLITNAALVQTRLTMADRPGPVVTLPIVTLPIVTLPIDARFVGGWPGDAGTVRTSQVSTGRVESGTSFPCPVGARAATQRRPFATFPIWTVPVPIRTFSIRTVPVRSLRPVGSFPVGTLPTGPALFGVLLGTIPFRAQSFQPLQPRGANTLGTQPRGGTQVRGWMLVAGATLAGRLVAGQLSGHPALPLGGAAGGCQRRWIRPRRPPAR